MADLVITAAQVGAIFARDAEIINVIAAVAITKGDAIALNTSGQAVLADASTSAANGFRGIALETVGANQAFSMLKRGGLEGFAVSSLNGDVQLFLSDTAGRLADAAGAVSVQVGRVFVLPDGNATKVVYLEADWTIE